MGYMLIASCKCGFEGEFCFGAGRSNFETYCSVPGIDLNTNKFITDNWKNKDQLKGKILFYTEPELYNGEIVTDQGSPLWGSDSIETHFGKVVLKISENKCPECNNYTMDFEHNGRFS